MERMRAFVGEPAIAEKFNAPYFRISMNGMIRNTPGMGIYRWVPICDSTVLNYRHASTIAKRCRQEHNVGAPANNNDRERVGVAFRVTQQNEQNRNEQAP